MKSLILRSIGAKSGKWSVALGAIAMAESLTTQRVLNFLKAFYSGDVARTLDQCTDDVAYFGYAPVELFTHLGHKRGKTALEQRQRYLHDVYSAMRYEITFLAAEGAKVAAILRVHLTKRSNGRIIQLDHANFFVCRNGLIAEHRQFLDSFDAVQQTSEHDIVDAIRHGKVFT